MNLPVEARAGLKIAAASGRIDHASSAAFAAALEPLLPGCKSGSAPLVLDFSGVEYISSVGLRNLIVAHRRVTAQGGKLAVAAMQPLVWEIFTIARLNLILPCYVDIDAACENLS